MFMYVNQVLHGIPKYILLLLNTHTNTIYEWLKVSLITVIISEII